MIIAGALVRMIILWQSSHELTAFAALFPTHTNSLVQEADDRPEPNSKVDSPKFATQEAGQKKAMRQTNPALNQSPQL